MQDREYAARIEAVKQRAHGRWTEILASLGVDERILKRRNLPCPLCGGTDRFQYTDKFGEGTTTAASAARVAASSCCKPPWAWTSTPRCVTSSAAWDDAGDGTVPKLRAFGRAHEEAGPAHLERSPAGDGGRRSRSLPERTGSRLPVYPKVLRFHPALGYYQKEAAGKSRKVAEYPAMLPAFRVPTATP